MQGKLSRLTAVNVERLKFAVRTGDAQIAWEIFYQTGKHLLYISGNIRSERQSDHEKEKLPYRDMSRCCKDCKLSRHGWVYFWISEPDQLLVTCYQNPVYAALYDICRNRPGRGLLEFGDQGMVRAALSNTKDEAIISITDNGSGFNEHWDANMGYTIIKKAVEVLHDSSVTIDRGDENPYTRAMVSFAVLRNI